MTFIVTPRHANSNTDTSRTHTDTPKPRREAQRYLNMVCWAVAIFGAFLIYYDLVVTPVEVFLLMLLIILASIDQFLFGCVFFLYRRRFSVGSFDEVRALLKSGAATGLILLVTGLFTGYSLDHPAGIGLMVTPVAVILMFGLRFAERLRSV